MKDVSVLKLMPPDAKVVVELGCGEGMLGAAWLQQQPFGLYVGVENDAAAARKGAQRLSRVHALPPQQVSMPELGIHEAQVDCLVIAEPVVGMLEGLAALEALLHRHLPYLAKNGVILLTVPNARYLQRVHSWLAGRADEGHAFTAAAVLGLMKKLGLTVTAWKPKVQRELLQSPEAAALARELVPFVTAQGIPEAAWEQEAPVRSFGLRVSREGAPKPLLVQTMMGELQVCARVRVVEPDLFLNTLPGVRAVHAPRDANLSLGRSEEEKILIRQRMWADLPEAAAQQRRLLTLGYITVAEIDDDPERWLDFHGKNGFFAFRGSHAVQVSTPSLAEYMRRWNPNVAVFPNQLLRLPLPKPARSDGKVRLFFGALNREADWRIYLEDVNEVLRLLKEKVEVVVLHDRQLFEVLDTPQKLFMPFCPYEKYTQALRSCDVAWLPLEDTRFNRMKSDLKFLECAGQQTAALASSVVYAHTLQDGVTGLLYRSKEEFRQRLTALLTDAALRQRLCARAYSWVAQERLLSQHYRRRYEWYQHLVAHKETLTAALLQRAPEIGTVK